MRRVPLLLVGLACVSCSSHHFVEDWHEVDFYGNPLKDGMTLAVDGKVIHCRPLVDAPDESYRLAARHRAASYRLVDEKHLLITDGITERRYYFHPGGKLLILHSKSQTLWFIRF